ncbi:MAG TPA: TIGR03000 domain-containing protein [Gemmataceae bacterium]|nr:TIGR03000 domain-containing protein [Gemmataceae bacterium]
MLQRRIILMLVCVTGLTLAGLALAQDEKKVAKMKVLLPESDASLTIEGMPTKATGEIRNFESPPLEPGKEYKYTLVAVIKPNNYTTITRKREVKVLAGKEVEVDMRENDPVHPDDAVIRFVPTPPDIVEAMIKLAGVGKDDVVYDLGCGDGRMVIAAVKQGGAKKGVGVDIDPQRVKEAKENAQKEGVADKVEIREGDALKVKDLSDATVVLLYMGNEFDLLLRPILQKQLKPGARIVSHRFTMGDWKPEKTETLTGKDGDRYLIHLWKIEKK